MTALIGNATWYVGHGEQRAYTEAPVTVESGGLCVSRNHALRDAAKHLLAPCIQLSDDLTRLRRATSRKTTEPLDFAGAVRLLQAACAEVGASLAGCAPTDNAFYSNPANPIATSAFIVGDFILVMPCNLYFDESLRLKEDYDYTLQHLQKFGVVARRNDILASFTHRSNSGGAVEYRTPALEQASIQHLRGRWGAVIQPNKKRANEILLKLRTSQIA
jgi:hypothetical protein